MRTMLVLAALVLGVAGEARSQWLFMGGGSTVEGDYLRGVGVAAWGIGLGEKASSEANAINTDTWIRFNEYVSAVLERENALNAAHRRAQQERRLLHHAAIQKRLRENPEGRDVDGGDALNVLLKDMNSGLIQESSHKYPEVALSVDEVRRIPFKLASVGTQSFSMRRLVLKQRGKWPLAFQDRRFDVALRSYNDALEVVLEEGGAGAAQIAAIDKLASRVAYLEEVLKQAFDGRPQDRRNLEGHRRIHELKATVEMLKTHKVQVALKDLDQYAGTTVNDLRAYMRDHEIQFAAATNEDERALIRGLYDKLKLHYEMVKDGSAHDGQH